jgi:hypothetical protein
MCDAVSQAAIPSRTAQLLTALCCSDGKYRFKVNCRNKNAIIVTFRFAVTELKKPESGIRHNHFCNYIRITISESYNRNKKVSEFGKEHRQ